MPRSERRKELARRRHRRKKLAELRRRIEQATTSEKQELAAKVRRLTPGADKVLVDWKVEA